MMVPDATVRRVMSLAAAGTAILITVRDGAIYTTSITDNTADSTTSEYGTVAHDWDWIPIIRQYRADTCTWPAELIKSLDRYTQSRNWIGNYREPVACELPRSLCPIRPVRRTCNALSAVQRAHRKRRHYIQRIR